MENRTSSRMAAVMLCLLTLSAVGPALAGSTVCKTFVPAGLVEDEHWTVSNSPYCLNGSIQVSLLTIDPGVEVLSTGDYQIEVWTTITAIGTETQPIRFGVEIAGKCWQGLRFPNAPTGSSLTNCIIEDAQGGALTVTGGAAPEMANILFRHNSTTGAGGAIFASGMLGDMALKSCTFLGNSASGNGGAISIASTTGDLIIPNCVFDGNISGQHGGAVHAKLNSGRTVRVTESQFTRNTAGPSTNGNWVGGAIYIEAGDGIIVNSRFDSNRAYARCDWTNCNAYGRGGAVYIGSAGTISIDNNLFIKNRAESWDYGTWASSYSEGSGLYINAGTVNLHNNVFSCNTASARNGIGGAGLTVNGGTVTLTNSTVARNSNTTGVYLRGGALTVSNSIIFNNNSEGIQISGSPKITYSNVQGGYGSAADNNLNLSPVFYGLGCEPADLVVASSSPCIDSGDPDPAQNDTCFPPARGAARNDMGAQGGPSACNWIPYEIAGLRFSGKEDLTWTKSRIATTYSVYRGTMQLFGWNYDHRCLAEKVTSNSFHDADPISTGYYYLITAWNGNGESPLGDRDLLPRTKCGNSIVTGEIPRPLAEPCPHLP